jgi:amino acid transporter
LGAVAITFTMLASAAPFTVVAGAISQAYGVSGVTAIPVAFLVVAVLLALFVPGYVAMSRRITHAGSLYAYVARALGKPAGTAAGLVALAAYNVLQVALYGGFGVWLAQLLSSRTGWPVPWWICAVSAWLLVAALGVLRIEFNGRVLALLTAAEIAVIAVLDVVYAAHPDAGGLSMGTLDPAGLLVPGAAAVLVTAVTGFVGFEQATVYSEESKDSRRTTARATYATLALTAVLYAGTAWLISVAAGPRHVAALAAKEQVGLMFTLAAPHVPASLLNVASVLFATSLLAALISFHNAVARYTFALGRESVLPQSLARTSRRWSSPKYASLLQSAVAVLVIGAYAVTGTDPLVKLFFWGGMTGGVGALLLITTAAVAIPVYLGLNPRGESLPTRIGWPVAAVAGLLAVTVAAAVNLHALLGVPASSPLPTVLLAGYALVAGVGAAWALLLRRTRPVAYARIGLGPAAATGHTETATYHGMK